MASLTLPTSPSRPSSFASRSFSHSCYSLVEQPPRVCRRDLGAYLDRSTSQGVVERRFYRCEHVTNCDFGSVRSVTCNMLFPWGEVQGRERPPADHLIWTNERTGRCGAAPNPATYEKLSKAAATRGCSMNSIVNRALVAFLRKEANSAAFRRRHAEEM
jgi:hypothetical protein